jgi:hypothetical protein
MADNTDDREVIYTVISEMLDHPDEHGIYPTTYAYDTLDAYCKEIRADARAAVIAEIREYAEAISKGGWPESARLYNKMATRLEGKSDVR